MGTASSPSPTVMPAITGVLHGGQSPIQGSAVTLYVTSTTATTYGAAATAIGTATTDNNGNFVLSPSVTAATCPAGQQVYVAAVGGYPSGSPTLANTSNILMGALGDCANVNSSTHVVINEITTVAAAYALSGFMTVSGSGAGAVVNVSAPAANRVSTPDSTDASGLQHAFLNAANLASVSGGYALPTTAAQSVAGASVTGAVPATEINTLADILQACVNTATGSANCASLFADTPSISGVAPTNTLQSVINLARNPYPSAAAMTGTTSLFSLVPASSAFLPNLATAPPDWALAIQWKTTTGALSTTPYYLTLDANDTVYYGASASANIVGLSAYSNSTPAYTAASAGTATRQIAADTRGNIWTVNNASLLLQYNSGTGGAPATYTTAGASYGVAVDKTGNVWVADAIAGSATVPNLQEFAYTAASGSGTVATYPVNYTAYVPSSFEPYGVSIDANQNIWTAPYFSNGTLAAVLPNTSVGTTGVAPAYGTVGTPTAMVSATLNGTTPKPIGLVFDTTGNAWYGITGGNTVTTAGLEEVVPNTFTAPITALTAQPLVADAVLGAKASQLPGIDGAGTIFVPDNQGAGALGIHAYSSHAGTKTSLNTSQTLAADQAILSPPAGFLGCAVAYGGTTCGTGSGSAIYNPRQVVVDSTGSLWMGITSGGVTQVIGLGAPAYPLLSIGRPSLAPGLTAVQALP